MAEPIRYDLFLRTATEVLRDAGAPMAKAQVFAEVARRVPPTEHEITLTKRGAQVWVERLDWHTVVLTASEWIKKSGTGWWSITPEGIAVLDRFPDEHAFSQEAERIYQAWNTERKAGEALKDPRLSLVTAALAAIPPGWWTTPQDLADFAAIPAEVVQRFLASALDVPGAHRVLSPTEPTADAARSRLIEDGVIFQPDGRPEPEQHATADDMRAVVETPRVGARAWLVRGSAVTGVNVVPQWISEGFVSIAAAHLTPVTAGTPLDDLQRIVESDYAHLSYHLRKAKLAELHAFLNRMQPGDAVITTGVGLLHVGRITGEASFGPAGDTRTTIRRTVSWQPDALDFTALPDALQGRLKSSVTVVDLTDVAEVVESLFGADSTVGDPAPQQLRQAVIPDLDAETVDRLLVGAEWLHEFVDLLRDRRQVILHGPPGTGKTYLALEVAEKLTDPANVSLVQFHPAYSYEDFFEGYRPAAVDDSGRVGFALTPGPFRKVVDEARSNPDQAYVLIIDEINRANLAKVFGELYFLLEYRDRAIDLMYASGDEGRDFTLPKNVYVIGTMNTADRSIALVDAAMRRRFAFLSLHPSDAHMTGVLRTWLSRRGLSTLGADVLDALNQRIPDRDFAVGPSYLMKPEAGRDTGLDRIWRTSILPLLEELHYGEDGVNVAKIYGLTALRASLRAEPAAEAAPEAAE